MSPVVAWEAVMRGEVQVIPLSHPSVDTGRLQKLIGRSVHLYG